MALRGLWFGRKIILIRGVLAVVRDYFDQRIEMSIHRLTKNIGAPFRVCYGAALALHLQPQFSSAKLPVLSKG